MKRFIKRLAQDYLPLEVLNFYRMLRQHCLEINKDYPKRYDVLKVGKYTYGHETIKILFANSGNVVHIGAFCSIAKDVTIFLGGDHSVDRITTYPFGDVYKSDFEFESLSINNQSKGSVAIGNDVWIGSRVTIMSGISIGDGAIVAANSHIVTDVEPYSIVGGNPGKLLRYRFEEEIIMKLLALKWWEKEDSTIKLMVPHLKNYPSKEVLQVLEDLSN